MCCNTGANTWHENDLIPKVESAILSNVRYYGRNIVEFHTSTSAHELIRREPNEVGGQNKLSIE
jgi:predicted nicotinamide N-methyase